MSVMSNIDVSRQEHEITEARKYVKSMLMTMKGMKDCMPDGQWEDGPEDMYLELRSNMPAPLDEEWLELKRELEENIVRWM
jgi:hypothetical protein